VPVVDYAPEALLPDVAVADVLVPVEPASQSPLRVVEVEDLQLAEPHVLVEGPERLLQPRLAPDVVSCGIEVAGVEAYPNPVRLLYPREDLLHLLETGADASLLSCHVLEQEDATRLDLPEGLVHGLSYPLYPHLHALPQVAAQVADEVLDPQRIAPPQLLDQHAHRLPPAVLLGRSDVGKVGHVGHDHSVPLFPPPPPELLDLALLQLLGPPSARVPREDLKCGASELFGPVDGFGDRSGDRDVGAQQHLESDHHTGYLVAPCTRLPLCR